MSPAFGSENSLLQKEIIWQFPIMNSSVSTNLHPEIIFTCDDKPKGWNSNYLCSLQCMRFGVFLNKIVTGIDRHFKVLWFWQQAVGPKEKSQILSKSESFWPHSCNRWLMKYSSLFRSFHFSIHCEVHNFPAQFWGLSLAVFFILWPSLWDRWIGPWSTFLDPYSRNSSFEWFSCLVSLLCPRPRGIQ